MLNIVMWLTKIDVFHTDFKCFFNLLFPFNGKQGDSL